MFLYFDKNGDLKEIINGYPLRQGASGINKLYVYFEDFEESMTPWVRYELPDGTHTIDTVVEDIENNIEIPYDEKRDLKFFKYYTPYTFIVITVPDDVLGFETDEDYLLQSTVSLATQDDGDDALETDGSDGEIIPLGLILLNVTHTADNVGYVDNENYISIAQFNYLKKLISDKFTEKLTPTTTINDIKAECYTLKATFSNGYIVVGHIYNTRVLQVGSDAYYVYLVDLSEINSQYLLSPSSNGATLIRNIVFNTQKMNAYTPSSDNQIANKKYVDDNKSSKTLLGNAQASYLMDDTDINILGLTMTFSDLDFTGYDLLLLTGLNSSCMILVTQVLTNLLSVMNLPYNDDGVSAVCKVRASKVDSNFTVNISSPNANMFDFETLPTFYLFGIKL